MLRFSATFVPTILLLFTPAVLYADEAGDKRAEAAQAFGKAQMVVSPQKDGLIICEGEEFQPASPGSAWKALPWGRNYYAATFANSFLSRKAFLGAPEQCERSTASRNIRITKAGRYLVLIRYEAAYRFETQFRVQIHQNGKTVFHRLYGARKNVKIWPFSQKLKAEVAWSWGAVENIVWEGHDAFASLQPGTATITLIADKQPAPAARRNVDLVMLTTDVEEVNMRIQKERYLPLDGLLTQSGDVWLKVTNRDSKPLTFAGKRAASGGNWQEHSPYWVHLRKWKPPKIIVAPGKTSAWVEVGSTMDTLNDGQWRWTGNAKYRVEFGLKLPSGKIESFVAFSGEGDLILAADADTRYSRNVRRIEDVLFGLLQEMKSVSNHGRVPTQTIIYAQTFVPRNDQKYDAAVKKFKTMFALTVPNADAGKGRGYIDVRSVRTPKLADYCKKLGARGKDIAVVSLGDEISLPRPAGKAATQIFHTWLKSRGLKPADVDPSAGGDWAKIRFNPGPALREKNPHLFYWSQRYRQHYGIQAIKVRTDILRKHLPNAKIGANYSPHYPADHMFLGEVYKWVTLFRDGGMTLPWSEDYIWQVPVGTAQMNHINFALFRAGLRGKKDKPILYYVMPHAPNNTPRMWRRLFFGGLGHGMTIINLFEFRPVHVAYTENHVDDPAMYRMILKSFREYGLFEDIIQHGRIPSAETALWFSETGDIWHDNHGSFAPAKRALYTAIRHQQVPLDVVVEADALDGTLKQYKVLYLTDAHVSTAAAKKIAAWVQAGGKLIATAGAGMFDEYNRPNKIMRGLMGVDQTRLEMPDNRQIRFIKQDLPFAKPIAQVEFGKPKKKESMGPVYGVRSHFKLNGARSVKNFSDGTPAIAVNKRGRGVTLYCGFLPSLTYFSTAI
ncbi:MAG: beta-galactosidase trimerization domain-containing protein, partial [Planctomycetes bacterium]|nr:beta-galactosidase trimerization domain-containing protein [Planctomycetota bacterium]